MVYSAKPTRDFCRTNCVHQTCRLQTRHVGGARTHMHTQTQTSNTNKQTKGTNTHTHTHKCFVKFTPLCPILSLRQLESNRFHARTPFFNKEGHPRRATTLLGESLCMIRLPLLFFTDGGLPAVRCNWI